MYEKIKNKLKQFKDKRKKKALRWANTQLIQGLEKVLGKAESIESLSEMLQTQIRKMDNSENLFQLYDGEWRDDLSERQQSKAEQIFFFPAFRKVVYVPTSKYRVIFSLQKGETKEDYLDFLNRMTEKFRTQQIPGKYGGDVLLVEV